MRETRKWSDRGNRSEKITMRDEICMKCGRLESCKIEGQETWVGSV